MSYSKMNPWIQKTVSLLLAMAMLTLPCATAHGEILGWLFGSSDAVEASNTIDIPTPSPAPEIKTSALEDDGMIRVYLKSLGDPQQLNLTLAGSYALEGDGGFYFDRNTRLALSCVSGNIYMAVSGLTINMGSSMTLTRHQVAEGEENGIYIDESEKDALFCGDLTLSATENGLQPILKLQIEDYLCGVVAYEMSDSFPIEALKAQAVAARTYALQRKWNAGKKAYDVVDTTGDQVYKGYIGDYVNVIEAVQATRGVVGVYNGGFATCYYTASNGGQTALPSQIWGGTGSDGYLAMVPDPYDLENPSSLASSLTIGATGEGSATLKQMLTDALTDQMSQSADTLWQFEAIENIYPTNPKFEGSLMYQSLAFDIRLSVQQPTPSPTPSASAEPMTETQKAFAAFSASQAPTAAPTGEITLPDLTLSTAQPETRIQTVILSVYDDIKDKLSLGLNGSDYELISVKTQYAPTGEAESFTLTMRRFGHGVGMSQRGAQQMAASYGKNWVEILNYYYPGMSIEKIQWPDQALTPRDELPDNVGAARPMPTPTPTPAPLPQTKSGEYYARVSLETRSSFLNVRSSPTTASAIVDQLSNGQRLIVSSQPDDEGWVSIYTAEISGYVKAEYLQAE